jgi:hypothetical protein
MTREDFLSGVEFEMDFGTFFKLEQDQRSISKVYRSGDRTRVVMEDHHMNVEKIGKVEFEAYTYLLGKKIVRKVRFEDLIEFKIKEELI